MTTLLLWLLLLSLLTVENVLITVTLLQKCCKCTLHSESDICDIDSIRVVANYYYCPNFLNGFVSKQSPETDQ